jgi:shikimate dehydrogenase
MESFNVPLNPQTKFLLSTSGSQTSIAKHNKGLQSLGVNFVYFSFKADIKPESYAALLRQPFVRGGAVTGQGLKNGLLPYLDVVDGLAGSTGAVNTVINEQGKLTGYNTDAFGFESAIIKHQSSSNIRISTAVIYGNGGVTSVTAHVLKNMSIAVTMAGRNPEKVSLKMSELNLSHVEGPYDLLINATPVSGSPIEEAMNLPELLKEVKVVFDHNMPEKEGKKNYLEEYCQKHGLVFISGREMYNPQMIKQWQMFLNGQTTNDGKVLDLVDEDIKKYWEI